MTSAGKDWREILKAQYAEVEQLEAIDKELNIDQQQITANIDKILKKKPTSAATYGTQKFNRSITGTNNNRITKNEIDISDNEPEPIQPSFYPEPYPYEQRYEQPMSVPAYQSPNKSPKPINTDDNNHSPGLGSPTDELLPKAPETTNRYQKAKIKMLEKQVEDSLKLRTHTNEQLVDLQKQVKYEHEENKQLKKRFVLHLISEL